MNFFDSAFVVFLYDGPRKCKYKLYPMSPADVLFLL